MQHSVAATLVAALVAWPRLSAAEDTLTFDDALARARERAPAIVAARSAIEQARGRLTGASALLRENPEVEGGAGARMVESGDLLEANLGVRQVFELGGQRSARIAGATAAVARESANTADVTRRVLRDAGVAFWRTIYAADRQRLAEQSMALAEETLHIAERRERAGDIGILDVNVARAAVARARSQVQSEMAASAAALGGLRMVLAMDAAEPLSPRGDLRDRRRYTLGELLERASERPDLQALTAAEREAQADIRLGRALEWPNVGVGANYERDDGNNVAMGTLTLTLPVFEHGQGLRAEASARERGAKLAAEATRRAVNVEVETAFAVCRRREEAVTELERNALPGLDANEALMRRSYEVGQLRLAELLAIRRETLETRSEYLDRLFEAAVAVLDVEASAGVLK